MPPVSESALMRPVTVSQPPSASPAPASVDDCRPSRGRSGSIFPASDCARCVRGAGEEGTDDPGGGVQSRRRRANGTSRRLCRARHGCTSPYVPAHAHLLTCIVSSIVYCLFACCLLSRRLDPHAASPLVRLGGVLPRGPSNPEARRYVGVGVSTTTRAQL